MAVFSLVFLNCVPANQKAKVNASKKFDRFSCKTSIHYELQERRNWILIWHIVCKSQVRIRCLLRVGLKKGLAANLQADPLPLTFESPGAKHEKP